MASKEEQREVLRTRVTNDFSYHPPFNAHVGSTHDAVRFAARSFVYQLIALVPPGRELSLAITAAQEAMMWANAGVACYAWSEDDFVKGSDGEST